MITYMDRSNIAVTGAQIMPEFHITLVEFGLMSSIFFWSYTAIQMPGGTMSERYGLRKTLAGAFGWRSAFAVLTAAGFSFISFLIKRVCSDWAKHHCIQLPETFTVDGLKRMRWA
ncbi:MAG: MFS transporter [Candidatus Micrarchaeaceae archaeon]